MGKVVAEPGAANAIGATVHAWLDARAPDDATLEDLVADVWTVAQQEAVRHGVQVSRVQESVTPAVSFDAELRERVTAALAAAGQPVPELATGAGHDAGVLAGQIPADHPVTP